MLIFDYLSEFVKSDWKSKCTWLTIGYQYIVFGFGLLTAAYIGVSTYPTTNMKATLFKRIWVFSAIVAAAATLGFYVLCYEPLPRRGVLE